MERGEVQGRRGWSDSSVKAAHRDWLAQKKIAIMVQFALAKHPELPDVPLVIDLAKTEDQRKLLKHIICPLRVEVDTAGSEAVDAPGRDFGSSEGRRGILRPIVVQVFINLSNFVQLISIIVRPYIGVHVHRSRSRTVSIPLPHPIDLYVKLENSGDVEALADCFAANATVRDEGQTYDGRAAIKEWMAATKRKYNHTVAPLELAYSGGKTLLTAELTGNFPGSPAMLEFSFVVKDRKIVSLEIK